MASTSSTFRMGTDLSNDRRWLANLQAEHLQGLFGSLVKKKSLTSSSVGRRRANLGLAIKLHPHVVLADDN